MTGNESNIRHGACRGISAEKRPAATVVLPAYNAGEWLRESVRSVLDQTMSDFQLIIVDDCSTDGTGRIAGALAASDPRIDLVSHEVNRGLSAARNSGIDKARGQYVCFLDADDLLHPEALQTLCCQQNDADVVIGDYYRGDRFPKYWLSGNQPEKVEMMDGKEALRRILYQAGILNCVCTMAVSRRLLANSALRFKEGILYEDLEFVPRLMLEARSVCHIKRDVYFYRINPRSIITTFNRRRLDVLTVTEGIERLLGGESEELRRAASDRRFSANYDMLLRMIADGDLEYEGEIAQCWSLIKARRYRELRDSNVRIKNKLGALLSYAGLSAVGSVARRIRRS